MRLLYLNILQRLCLALLLESRRENSETQSRQVRDAIAIAIFSRDRDFAEDNIARSRRD